MKTMINRIFWGVLIVSAMCYATFVLADSSYLGVEAIMNRIFDSTNNAIKMTLASDMEMGNTPYSIDGGTNGLAFDTNNDNSNEFNLGTTGVPYGTGYSVQAQHEEIAILLSQLTSPVSIFGGTGTGANNATETGYENAAGRTWTYSGGLTTDKQFVSGGSTYCYVFDGVDSYISTPDADDMSFITAPNDDSPFSMGCWIYISSTGTGTREIMAKEDLTSGSTQREYEFRIENDGKLYFYLVDESSAKFPRRVSDSALATNTWLHIVVTYDGGGGATAATGLKLYVNGAVIASTAVGDDAAYVSMDAGSAQPTIGSVIKLSTGVAGSFFIGAIVRPFQMPNEMSAAGIWKLYESTRKYYGV